MICSTRSKLVTNRWILANLRVVCGKILSGGYDEHPFRQGLERRRPTSLPA